MTTPTDSRQPEHALIALQVALAIERLGLKHLDVATALGLHATTLSRQLAAEPRQASLLTVQDRRAIVGVLAQLAGCSKNRVRQLLRRELPPSEPMAEFLVDALLYEQERAKTPTSRGQPHCFTPAEMRHASALAYAFNPPRAGGKVLTRLGKRVIEHYHLMSAASD